MQTSVRHLKPVPEAPLVAQNAQNGQLGPLDEPGFTFTSTGLAIQPWVTYEAWTQYGRKLQLADRGIQWALGDWIIHGETYFKDRAEQAVEFTGLKLKTLQNYATVAERVKKSRRRDSDVVDFTTHAEVASLPAKEQERILAMAEADPIAVTSRVVRREVHKVKRQSGKSQSEIELLQTPQVQEFLQLWLDDLDTREEAVPLTARFLRTMVQAFKAQVYWQKNRTVMDDCEIIQLAVKKSGGQIAEDDLYQWLTDHGYFMSDPEFEERLEYMNREDVRMALVTDAGPEGKQENRRGKLSSIVAVPWTKIWDQGSKRERDEDED